LEKIPYTNTSIYFDDSFSSLVKYIDLDFSNIFLIVDSNIYDLHPKKFHEYKNILVVESVEDSKSLTYVDTLIDKLILLGCNRSSFIVGVGGGVISDIAGFVASIYMRGVRFGFVPTTLLSITDASIGGKNGVNFKGIKNIIGTINEPEFLLIDFSFLETLSDFELSNGYSEIIKHACISSNKLFSLLENVEIDCKKNSFKEILKDSIKIKISVINNDLNEKNSRKLLNFGHTFGHAIEAKYKISHGEAISLGIILATNISSSFGYLNDNSAIVRITNLLNKFNLPTDIQCYNKESLLYYVTKDKKSKGKYIDFVVLNSIGNAEVKSILIDKILDE
jgi:3-dehydroquinate synthase